MEPLKYHKMVKLGEGQSPLIGNTALQLLQAVYGDEKNLSLYIEGMKAPREGEWRPIRGKREELEGILRQFGDKELNLTVNVELREPGTESQERVVRLLLGEKRKVDEFPEGYSERYPQISILYVPVQKRRRELLMHVAGFSREAIEEAVEKMHEILFPERH